MPARGHKGGYIWLHVPRSPDHLFERSMSVPNQALAGGTSLDESQVHLPVQLHHFALKLLKDNSIVMPAQEVD